MRSRRRGINRLLQKYLDLLLLYLKMVQEEPWWDGRREPLANEMAGLVKQMPEHDQKIVVQIQRDFYEKRIKDV